MKNLSRYFLPAAAMLLALTGCVVRDTKPLPKVAAVQAQTQIPEDELLDVAVRPFDTGIPPELAKDDEALEKRRIYPDIREAESRYFATLLRSTLESTGQWGAVRVIPSTVEFVDVVVSGKILDSTGAHLALEVNVVDSTGRRWIDKKRYESIADLGSYKTDASLKQRDPFQNVYSQIANDMVAARDKLLADDRRDIRRVTDLRFANDFAPDAMQGFLSKDEKTGMLKVVRLPAQSDPFMERIDRIRERDAGVVDTVNSYYGNFADQMRDPYGSWRRSSSEEIEKETRTRNQARTRTFLGAAAVLASVFVPGQCSRTDYNCRRIESAARTAGAIGGTAAVLSGLKKYSDVKNHTAALKELSHTFQNSVSPQVVDVEGRTLRLTGTADEQYREWRELLKQMYIEENGGTPATVKQPDVPAAPGAAAEQSAVPVTPGSAREPAAPVTPEAASQPPAPPNKSPETTAQ